jgi:hypothetical protein
MDPRIARLKTVKGCDNFAKNALERGFPELAAEARERGVQLRAEAHGAGTAVERECLESVYAFEEVRSEVNGRRTKASRTWQAIGHHGIIPAIELIVTKHEVSAGFRFLAEMGLQRYAFEAVVLRHPDSFTIEARTISRQRLEEAPTP